MYKGLTIITFTNQEKRVFECFCVFGQFFYPN